ncbi:hypothetical protein [Kordiimonas marina]|uniref:hypothetical protein n=1 Tax=Kordiimonas marina TaxID=2872312 RepID=UPI001FF14B59|nr:hypothetical protein [Kordiimonas marina]MCJ9427803.1 hypothetical protein [Kordiimonas marina]
MNYTDPMGEGKVKYFIRAYKWGRSIWKEVSKSRALRARLKQGDVKITGRGARTEAKRMDRALNGDRTVRHEGHELPNGEKGMNHFQHRNGGTGHTFYQVIAGLTAAHYLGDDSNVAAVVDFFNPVSDVKEVIDVIDEETSPSSDGEVSQQTDNPPATDAVSTTNSSTGADQGKKKGAGGSVQIDAGFCTGTRVGNTETGSVC